MILGMLNSISLLSFTSILMIHLSIVHPQIHWIAGDKKHHHLSLLSDILALQATYLPPLGKQVANLDFESAGGSERLLAAHLYSGHDE